MPPEIWGLFKIMSNIVKMEGIEINIDAAKSMKKNDLVKAYNNMGKDGNKIYEEVQKLTKKKPKTEE